MLSTLLMEDEKSIMVVDPSRSMMEQVRARWLDGYDDCVAACQNLQAEMQQLQEQCEEVAGGAGLAGAY
jgi:hypothetical protein